MGEADRIRESIRCACGQTAHRLEFSLPSGRRQFIGLADGEYNGPNNLKLRADGKFTYKTKDGAQVFDPK